MAAPLNELPERQALFARRAPGHGRPRGAGAMGMSLYEDQEKAVVRRGELEEGLMSAAPTQPLKVIADRSAITIFRDPSQPIFLFFFITLEPRVE